MSEHAAAASPPPPPSRASAGPAPLLVPAAQVKPDAAPPLAVLLGADFSALSITPSRADSAPGVVRVALPRFATWNADSGVDLIAAGGVHDLGDVGATRMAWDEAFTAIVARAGEAYALGHFAIALGGDHSVTWPLVTAFSSQAARVGIVQLDVHHDVRPLDAGPNNGTPIRGLIEQGQIRGEDVVQLGIHPFANRREHGAFCDEAGIRRVSLDQLAERGPAAVAAATLADLAACDAIYLTVDIDVLDRAYAPGTVAALPGGLSPAVLGSLVSQLAADPRVRAMDIVEFDPARDIASVTAYNVAQVLLVALSAVARRATRS